MAQMRTARTWAKKATVLGMLLGSVAGSALSAVFGEGVARAQETVGMAVMVRGAPMISSGNTWKRLQLQSRIASGQKIRCPKDAEAVVVLFSSGARFRVAPGKAATVAASGLSGAQGLGTLGGASGSAARALHATRTGAISARATRGHGPLPARLSGDSPLHLLQENRTLTWRKNPAASINNFTLFDDNSDVVFNLRTDQNSVTLPQNIELKPRQPYVWRVVFYKEDETNARPSQMWGMTAWISPEDVAELAAVSGGRSVEEIAKGDPTAALLIARAYENKRLYQPAFEILDALNQSRRVAGAGDALMALYGQMPTIARALGPLQTEYALWEFRNR